MKFYVYEHWRPDTDVCFYVGKGHGRRAYKVRETKRNRSHKIIVATLKELGFCVEVRMVAGGLTEHESFAIECERIAFWRASGVVLANRTDGGEGASGYKHSDEFKEKARQQMIAYNKNRQFTPEMREKMRAAKLGRKLTAEHIKKVADAARGRKLPPHSAETRAKISKAKTGSQASDETRMKMRLSRLGKSSPLKGRPWSEKRRIAQRLERRHVHLVI